MRYTRKTQHPWRKLLADARRGKPSGRFPVAEKPKVHHPARVPSDGLPMSNVDRVHNYQFQTGRTALTVRQQRAVRRAARKEGS